MIPVRQFLAEFPATAKGAVGIGVADVLSYVSPVLTVIVLVLTIANLALELRKKLRR